MPLTPTISAAGESKSSSPYHKEFIRTVPIISNKQEAEIKSRTKYIFQRELVPGDWANWDTCNTKEEAIKCMKEYDGREAPKRVVEVTSTLKVVDCEAKDLDRKVKDPEDFVEEYEERIKLAQEEIDKRKRRLKTGKGDPDWDREAIIRVGEELLVYQSRLKFWKDYVRRHTE